MSQVKPMQADIVKALKAVEVLVQNQELPQHYRHKAALLQRGLEILGRQLYGWEQGARQAKETLRPKEVKADESKETADGNQGA